MLSINLDKETESYLAEIIAKENITSEELSLRENRKHVIANHIKTRHQKST